MRFSALVKAKAVTKTVHLRLRGENSKRERIVYQEKKVGETHDWADFSIELDVGSEVALFSYGLTFRSPGKIWMSHPVLEVLP